MGRFPGFDLDPRIPRSQYHRRRRYFAVMIIAVALFVGAGVVYQWAPAVAIGMAVVAAFMPPLAAIVGNRWERGDKWWDEL
ncbi:DUF3099 domain-containing protein [Streptomyces sp. NPDC051940]|uniref:DUF3099 domain-containing protein n=1 Tax=Streptomyces sp. NPDC051940 TaxID=3155675 RepID=UPI0034318792